MVPAGIVGPGRLGRLALGRQAGGPATVDGSVPGGAADMSRAVRPGGVLVAVDGSSAAGLRIT
jgi:hypothetical protein